MTDGSYTPLDELWACPYKLLNTPDAWQKALLSDPLHHWLLCCSRQSGKTEVVTAQAIWEIQCCASFVLVLAPSEPQAFEFVKIAKECYRRQPLVEIVEENKSQVLLSNGGRLLALPNNERTVRVYRKVDRLIIDEASRVPDNLYAAVTPMLAVSKGRKTLLSTPFGKRGFFFTAWTRGTNWRRAEIPWWKCPRITQDIIEEERSEHGELWVQQEFECKFLDVQSSFFNVEEFAALIDTDIQELSW